MKQTLGVRLLWICLIFSPALAAAEESSAAPSAEGVARAGRPGCAKLLCQRRGPSVDRGASSESTDTESSGSGVSVLFGLGAGAFRGPAVDAGFVSVAEVIRSEAAEAAPERPRIDPGVDLQAVAEDSPQRTELEGPTVSIGVALAQPLLAADALRLGLGLGLEERFTLAAVLPLSGGSCFAGFGDILLTARHANWPVQVAVGPSLAVAQLDVRDEAAAFAEAGVIAGGAGLLRLDLTQALPGALDLVGHYGKALNYDGSSYRDLQLAFALRL